MRRFLIYFLSTLIISGASAAFANVYVEDFELNTMDEIWATGGQYEILNNELHMFGAVVGDVNNGSGLWLQFPNELFYRFEADIKISSNQNQWVGIVLAWQVPIGDTWYGIMIHFTIRDEVVYAVIYNYFPEGSNHNDDEYFSYQEYLGQADKDKWHSLSITLLNNSIKFGLNGIETDLFQGLFPYPASILSSEVQIHSVAEKKPDYYVDNLKAFTATGTSPNDIMDSVITSVDEWIQSGELVGTGSGMVGRLQLRVFTTVLLIAERQLNNGNIIGACNRLRNASNMSDGSAPDLVKGDAVEDLQRMISILKTDIGCE